MLLIFNCIFISAFILLFDVKVKLYAEKQEKKTDRKKK